MRNIVLFIAACVLSVATKAQSDSVVYDDEGHAFYANQVLISFHPDVVDTAIVNDTSKQSGFVYEFIKPNILSYLMDSGYYNSNLGELTIHKVFSNLTTNIEYSISRLGDTVPIPPFWATFIVEWPDTSALSVPQAGDSLNAFFPAIQAASPNYAGTFESTPNDTFYNSQASFHPTVAFSAGHINVEGAWDRETGKEFIKVGVIDNGVDWKHEDFGNGFFNGSKIKGGLSYIDPGKPKPIWQDSSNAIGPHGTFSHGTRVAGIIAALRNNHKGVAGIAGGDVAANNKGVSLISLKVSNGNLYWSLGIAADAIVQASAWRPDSSYGFGAHILNNSYAFSPDAKVLRDAVKFAFRNKTIFVASRGNYNDTEAVWPACYEDELAVSVGASNASGTRASFSSFGENVDVIAPGTEDIVRTTHENNAYGDFNGTSSAAPHVSGLAALMASYIDSVGPVNNNIAPEDVEFLIQKYAADKGSLGYDQSTGWGLIHADSVMDMLAKPRYSLWHFSYTVSLKQATLVQSNILMNLKEPYDIFSSILPYLADKYKIRAVIHHNIPHNYLLLNYWKRHSSSLNVWKNFPSKQPVLEYFDLVSLNLDSTVVEGFIYNVKFTNPLTHKNDSRWLPADTTMMATFAYTVHIEDPTLSVDNPQDNPNGVLLYPNPATGLLTIRVPGEDILERVNVYSLDGRMVLKETIATPAADYTLAIGNLAVGLYIVEVVTENGLLRSKFIKSGL